MDSVTNWKKILLQWVVKCNLLEKTFYSLDQTEVETFFAGFKDLFKEGNICQYKNLSDFFKEEYPLFEPHYDDENTLSSSDHIYVYSLLLHFSCVKVSNAFFQENCKKLDDFAQRNITTFFEKLLNEESLTKQTLRRVIASIHGFTPPSTRLMYTADSPVKTPKKTDISPPTPRSCMLIEKNKKVNFLNAQLDTLSYEKSVLETDLKSSQDKIDKLLREHKKLNQENQDLKNEISSRSKESIDCGTRQHSGEEQIRKLIKKNAQYEEEIAKLREQIDELSLSEEKNILCEKLKKAEIQMKYLQDNVSCLAQQVDDFTQELEQKDRQIKDLSETRDELEQYIKELRSSSSHSGPDLNTSSEFLDMSRVANSSGSLHSPENLGLVVDIKLREKENENEKLREEISAIRIDSSKLSKAMSELTTKYTKLFDVCDDNLNIVDDENPTADNPGNCFIIFSNYMQRFAGKYEENCFELKRVKENERKMEELNLSFASKLEESQNLNGELRKEMDELQSAIKTLKASKADLEMVIVQLENKLENCLNERSKEANALQNLQKEMEKVKLEKQDADNEVEYLTTCLDTKEDILLKLAQENDDKDQMLKESQQKLRELDDQNQNLKQQLLESEMVEKELREQFKNQNHQLSIKLERTQQSFVDLTSEKNYLLTMTQANHKQIDVLNAKIQTLTADQSEKALMISSLESDKAALIASMQEKVDSLKTVIDEYQEGFEMKAREFNELTEKWRLVEAECVLKEQKLQEACQQLDRTTTAFQKVTKNIGHHVNNLKSRLGLDASMNSSSSLDLDDIEDVGFKEEVKCLMDGIVEASDRVVEEKSSVSKKLNELKRLVEELNEEKIAKELVLQQSIEKLENDLREKREHVETLSEKQKQAEQMLAGMETDLKLANDKLAEREEEFERTKSQLDNETSEKLKIQDELKRIVEELNEEKIASVANKTAFVEREVALQGSVEKLENDLREKTEHVETLSEKQKQVEEMLARLENDIKLANEKLAEREEEFESTKSQLESETSEKLKIQDELMRLVEELNEQNIASVANKTAFVEKETALHHSVEKLENDLREKAEHVETLSEKQKQAEQMLTRLETALQLANDKLAEREEEFERTKSQLDNETSEKLKIQDELKRIVEELNEEKIASVANKNAFVEREVALQGSVERLENDLREKTQHVETLSKKQEQAEQKLARLETDLKLANEKLAEREEEFERTKSQLDSETSEKLKIQKELENVVGLRHQLQTKIDLLESTLTKMRDDSSKNSDNLTQEFWKAKSQLQDVVNEKSQVQEELEHLASEFESTKLQLENEIAKKQKMLGDLTSKALKISQELESVKQEKEQIRENVLHMRIEFDNELENVKLQSSQRLKEFEEANSRLENEVQTLALEKSKLKEDFESSKLRWESENTEKHQINESLKRSQSQQEKIKRDLESVKLDLESKIAENLKCREKLEESNKAIKNLERKCKETSHQRDLESAAKAEMKKLLEASKQELSALRTSTVNSEAEYETLKQKAVQYKKQLDNVNAQLKKEATEKSELAKALQQSKKQLDELSEQKCSLEAKHKDSTQEVKKYKNLYQTAESELKRLQSEETRLFQEIQTLTATHESQIQKCNKEIEEQKENVSRLIQEIASIRKEKEFAEEEKRILTNRLESKINEQMSKETSHKSIEEKLQSTERDVLVKLNLLKTEQLKSQDLENQLKKLQIETTKYRETAEANTKRIEKLALNLGEAQAKCQKLKKEADAAQSSLDLLKPSAEMTQRDNCRLNQECRLLKEKLVKLGKSKDQLESKLETLQNQFDTLADEKQVLENSESDLKKIKNNLEDKIRKLAKSLSDANVALSRIEQDKVQLNLEVGGLNKQLEENKALLNMKLIEIENLSSNLIEAKGTNAQLLELNEKHQIEAREIHDENSRLNDQLSKLSLRLEITQREHETAMSELERLKTDVETSRSEREAIEKDHRTAIERLMGVEERRATEVELSSKIKCLEAQITKLTIEKCDMEELRSQDKQMIEELNHNIAVFTAKLQKSRSICEENEKKWAEEREQLLADVRGCEERIKETRFELEGKLEKMKNKMKTLYNDEVAKQKKKQEREVAVYKSEIDSLKTKNDKHEEHIKKLSNQLFRLNENLLEFKKENTFLKTKLKDIESKPRQSIRMRPSSTHQVLSSNLRMEDEEGEIFNNTYLSDLKDGRMSEYFNNDICAQELQYRNSLVPPHLKSTYLAQFDHQMGEEEIRDTPALDDSSSTLLNTGQRKKVSGATSYKRPGPPTPSKNAGRLSFGGIGELNRELLKESHDSASCSSSSTKTPAKFKFFSSKLSMRGDERKSVLANFKRKLQSGGSGGTIQCSSTPRKSKAHIDQRRLLDQIMSTVSPGPNYSPADSIIQPVNLPSSLKNSESNRRMSAKFKWRQRLPSFASDSGNSDVNCAQKINGRLGSGSGSGSAKRRVVKRAKDRRGSIYFRGTMFARNCRTPTNDTREAYKSKAKIHRIANFNKYRQHILNERESLCSNWDDEEACNNNNNDDGFFMEKVNQRKHNLQQVGFTNENDENFNNDQSSKHFQQLLESKESHAPFEISGMQSNQSFLNANNSSSNAHSTSRTIYGASVILNRKIPHINTTMVRKSSIYVKGSDGKSVILVTNQTITLKDLAAMWFQMNFSTRSVIAFSLTATLIGVISFAIQFINR